MVNADYLTFLYSFDGFGVQAGMNIRFSMNGGHLTHRLPPLLLLYAYPLSS